MQLLRTAACLFAAAALVSAKEKVIGKKNAKMISREQIHALHHLMDNDDSGKVSPREMLLFHVNTRAEGSHSEAQELFKWIDKDGDQKVPLEELENWLKIQNRIEAKDGDVKSQIRWKEQKNNRYHSFELADKNKDGSLNSMEIVAFLFPDTDSDLHEYQSKQTFATLDRDRNRFLSMSEFVIGDGDDPKDMLDLNKDPGFKTKQEAELKRLTQIKEAEFKILDLNKDGKVDPKEFTIVNSPLFEAEHNLKQIMSRADSDGDGEVDVMELDEAYEKIRDSESAHKVLKDAVEHHEL